MERMSSFNSFRIGGDLLVRRLGYGTMRLVGEGAWGEPTDRAHCRQLLQRAVSLGVTLVDTADAYGPEIAEQIIAEALYPYPENLVLTTKGGITRQGPAQTEYVGRAGYLIQCVEMSLRRLRLECIPLYQLHRIDPLTPLEESLGALVRMREQGKIRHIGLSEVTVEQIEAARQITPIASVQNRYSLTDRRHELVLDYCEREQIAFLPWYPLGAGKLLRAHSHLDDVAQRVGCTTAQLSLAWLLGRSPVMVPIPGTASLQHLEENMAAASIRLPAEIVAELEQITQ